MLFVCRIRLISNNFNQINNYKKLPLYLIRLKSLLSVLLYVFFVMVGFLKWDGLDDMWPTNTTSWQCSLFNETQQMWNIKCQLKVVRRACYKVATSWLKTLEQMALINAVLKTFICYLVMFWSCTSNWPNHPMRNFSDWAINAVNLKQI